MIKKVTASAAILAAAVVGAYTIATSSSAKTWNITPTSSPSLLQAEQQAQPGDTIMLSGTWKNTTLIPYTSGTASAPITYKSNSTTKATFDGAGTYGVANTAGKSYIVFDGITFKNGPVNKGVTVRGSHITFKNDVFNSIQMQLIGASYNTIIDNNWRIFVASYVNGLPQTSGDMLYLVSGSHDNEIARNDMKYAGHSLIEIGTGWGVANANNWIHDNILSNPWYRCMALSDDGGGTIIENNQCLDVNTVPTLYSTVASIQGQLVTSSNAIQIIGSNFIVRNNTISNAVALKGIVQLGGWWYYGAGAPIGGAMVQAQNNQIYGNTIQNSKGAAAIGIEQDYTPGTDAAIPNITGNVMHDNTFINLATSGMYSWDKSSHFETMFFRSFKGATPWVGLNGNKFYSNTGVSSTNAYRYSYVNASGATTLKVYSLPAFQALDPFVYGNS